MFLYSPNNVFQSTFLVILSIARESLCSFVSGSLPLIGEVGCICDIISFVMLPKSSSAVNDFAVNRRYEVGQIRHDSDTANPLRWRDLLELSRLRIPSVPLPHVISPSY
jgi:hypothetical protein